MAVHYPVEFPFDSAREIVRIFNAGTVTTDRASLAESLWNLQGYAQRTLIGESHNIENGVTIYKSSPPPNDEEIIALLAEFDKGATADPNVPRFHFPFDPQALLNWCLSVLARVL